MMNRYTKSNESFRPQPEDSRMHRVTIDVWLPGDSGEIYVLTRAAFAAQTLASRGTMPTNTHTITREILETLTKE